MSAHPIQRRHFLRNSLLLAGAAALLRPTRSAATDTPALPTNKRDRMLAWLEGKVDYVPAAFFMHFDEGYKVGQAAATKHKDYFRHTEMDFVKIQYEQHYTPLDWLKSPSDWARLECRGLDFYEPQLVTVRELVKELKGEALIVMTLYSPFMWAGHCATLPVLLRHMHEDPEAVKRGLDILTESQLRFVRECIRIGVDGFYMSTQGSETGQLEKPELFQNYVKPSDFVAMQEAQARCPFNILHVCDYNAPYATYDAVADYPGHVINCSNHMADGSVRTWKSLAAQFKRPLFGGLERKGLISTGGIPAIEAATRAVLSEAPKRFMLGAECTIPGTTPWDNLRAAIRTAHAHQST